MAQTPSLINGIRYDVSSYRITFNGRALSTFGVKSLTYEEDLEPGEIYGTSPQKIGRTRGKYGVSASLELWADEAIEFESLIAPNGGLGEIPFQIGVAISETGRTPIFDEIVGCRVKKRSMEMPGAGGSDGASVKYELDVMYLKRNGKSLLSRVLQ